MVKNDSPVFAIEDVANRSRRSVVWGVGGGLIAAGLVARPEAGGRRAVAQAAWPISGAFVGSVTPHAESHVGQMFIAVIAAPLPAPDAARQVRAYVCNGVDRDDWFVGEATGDNVSLASEDGGVLRLSLGAQEASGSFTLDEGDEQTFTAAPAVGSSGLYNVLVSEDRGAFGASGQGLALGYTIADGRLTATFLHLDGRAQEVTMKAGAPHPPGAYRVIVLEDGPSVWLHGAERKRGRVKSYVCNGTDA